MNSVVLVEYSFMKLNDKLMFGFQENQFFLRVMFLIGNYQFIYTASDFLKVPHSLRDDEVKQAV